MSHNHPRELIPATEDALAVARHILDTLGNGHELTRKATDVVGYLTALNLEHMAGGDLPISSPYDRLRWETIEPGVQRLSGEIDPEDAERLMAERRRATEEQA